MKTDQQDFARSKQRQDPLKFYSGIRTLAGTRRNPADPRKSPPYSCGVARSRPEQDDALSWRGRS